MTDLCLAVVGLPALGRVLSAAAPGGARVVSLAAGPEVERDLASRARGLRPAEVVFVIAAGVDPCVDRLPARLARGSFRAVVLTGLAAPTLPFPDHPALVSLAAPFTADDVLAAVTRLPGDHPLFLPLDDATRVYAPGSALTPEAPPPGPTLDEWLAAPADPTDDEDPPGPLAEPGDDDPLGALVEPGDDDPLGALVDPAPAATAAAPTGDDPLGPLVEPEPEPAPWAATATATPASHADPLEPEPVPWATAAVGDPLGTPVEPAPASVRWAAASAAALGGDGDPLGPLVEPDPVPWAAGGDGDPLGPLVQPEPAPWAAGGDGDPLGPLVQPEPDGVRVMAAAGVGVPADLPRWAHLPPPPPPPPPVDRPVPWADGGWPVPPVIPGDALPTPGALTGDGRRRGRVLSVCSYKGGSGKCLTGDSLVVDPVSGVPHRLDEVVADPALATVFTLCGATIRCTPITDKVDSGTQPTVRVELASGRRVTVTPHHPFLLADGWRPAHDIAVGEAVAVAARTPFPRRPVRVCGTSLAALAREVAAGPATMPAAVYRLPADQLAWVLALLWGPGESGGVVATEALARAVQHLLTRFAVASRIAADPGAAGAWRVSVGGVAPEDTAWDEVVAIVPAGERRVWDLCVEPTRCFVADDVVVHNTTTALLAAGTLARALRPAGKRVALVDANTAQSSVGTVLQRPARGSVLDLVRSDVDEGVLAAALTPVGGLDVLLGAPDLRTADRRLITTGLYRRIVATLRRTHDYVIVDTPVAEAVDHELFEDFVLRDSDSLVVVLDPHRETIHNNVEWLDIIGDPVSAGGRNVVPERIGVVLNRADPAQGWNGRTVGDQFRRYRYLGAIPDSPSIARAANEARLLDRFDPEVDHAVRTVLAALVAEPLVAPDLDPTPPTPLARLRAVGTRLRPGRNAQVHG
ncbi:MAG TPA: hypothetical protein VKB57_00855 [Acidimicrobiales bacterium]|nr:hypothetical protein [Acidimicrobiales bacterium]